MKLAFDIKKSLEENAENYFEKAKKAKKKLKGAEEALEKSKKELKQLLQKEIVEAKKITVIKPKPAKEWFEKLRWFLSSEGFLCVGGRDATSNEVLIKKHCSDEDLVFHADLAGSPFFVVKSHGKKVGEQTINETSIATASYSRAWRLGLNTLEVYHVKPKQVSKKTRSGEYIKKGAFMIYGKKSYVTAEIKLAVGITKDGKIIGGPLEALKKHCEKRVTVIQGEEKTSDAAKKIKKMIGGELDELIRALPSGGVKVMS